MITRLGLKNFVAFDEIEIDFSSKINVIIGENGTGKTQLMKAAYALSWIHGEFQDRAVTDFGVEDVAVALAAKLLRLFLPMKSELGELYHHKSKSRARLEAEFAPDARVAASFARNSHSIVIHEYENLGLAYATPIFVPTKEVLTWLQTIKSPDSDQETIQRLFDDTYLDLCANLLVPSSNYQERLDVDPRFGTLFPRMVNRIGGRYEVSDGLICFRRGEYLDRRVQDQHKFGDRRETTFRAVRAAELSNNMTAEGFRKIGILQQLLSNQMLDPGSTGPLFWDEPESNMNPTLMRFLVDILLELARNGQQIILATHDYVLLKWFDLLTNPDLGDQVLYHSVFRDDASRKIMHHSTPDYLDIQPNPIDDTFEALINVELDRSMGDVRR